MQNSNRCFHEWIEKNNKLVCSKCKKSKLKRFKLNDDLSYGIRIDGRKYLIRKDRKRYFYPEEWNKFYNNIPKKHQLLFLFLIITGARISEAYHFKKSHCIDDERKKITLTVTKRKARVVGEEDEGKHRSFKITKNLYNKLKKSNYKYPFFKINTDLTLKESKKLANKKAIALRNLMKRHLKEIGIKDWQNFALHNIRKTNGMWLKTIGVNENEICARLGHKIGTFYEHYGSADPYIDKDKREIHKFMEELL